MRSRPSLVFAFLLLVACGSDSASTTPPPADGGSSGSSGSTPVVDGGAPPTSVECNSAVKAGMACSDENGCCQVSIPDGFGPEGFRCKAKSWTADTTCLPPPPACATPLTGSLDRVDGTKVAVTCIEAGGQNGVTSFILTLEGTSEHLEVYLDRAPAAGDVLDVIAYTQGPRPDAGAANRAALRIGRPGGFAGFDVTAKSASGKLTVTTTSSTSLRGSLDVELTGVAPWAPGKLTGSW